MVKHSKKDVQMPEVPQELLELVEDAQEALDDAKEAGKTELEQINIFRAIMGYNKLDTLPENY